MGRFKEIYLTLIEDYQLTDHEANLCLQRYIDLKTKYPTIQSLILHMYSKGDPYSLSSLASLHTYIDQSITKAGLKLSVEGTIRVLHETTFPITPRDQSLHTIITNGVLLPLIGLTYYKPEPTIDLTKETFIDYSITALATYLSNPAITSHIHQSLFNIYLKTNIAYYS